MRGRYENLTVYIYFKIQRPKDLIMGTVLLKVYFSSCKKKKKKNPQKNKTKNKQTKKRCTHQHLEIVQAEQAYPEQRYDANTGSEGCGKVLCPPPPLWPCGQACGAVWFVSCLVARLLNAPVTCWYISGMDLLRQLYMLPH